MLFLDASAQVPVLSAPTPRCPPGCPSASFLSLSDHSHVDDESTENQIFQTLVDVFRYKPGAGAELRAIKPTVAETLVNPENLTWQLLTYDPDYPGYSYDDIIDYTHPVPKLEALMRQAMILHKQYRWGRKNTRLSRWKGFATMITWWTRSVRCGRLG
jgi:hypothetical protein